VAEGLARTLDEMGRRGVDVLMLGREGNARFVSEATRLWLAGTRPFAPGCVVVRETGAVHLLSVTDVGVPRDIPTDRLYPMSWNPVNIIGTVAAIPGVASARSVGVDGLTPLFDQLLSATLPGAELVDGEAVMRAARRVKSPAEVEGIRAAISVAEVALGAAVDAMRPGVSEVELKGVFEERRCQLGPTTPAY
jgi:Xaa-Pro dipeptidase